MENLYGNLWSTYLTMTLEITSFIIDSFVYFSKFVFLLYIYFWKVSCFFQTWGIMSLHSFVNVLESDWELVFYCLLYSLNLELNSKYYTSKVYWICWCHTKCLLAPGTFLGCPVHQWWWENICDRSTFNSADFIISSYSFKPVDCLRWQHQWWVTPLCLLNKD